MALFTARPLRSQINDECDLSFLIGADRHGRDCLLRRSVSLPVSGVEPKEKGRELQIVLASRQPFDDEPPTSVNLSASTVDDLGPRPIGVHHQGVFRQKSRR